MPVKKFLAHLQAHDVAVVCFAILLSLVSVVFHGRVPQWLLLIAVNLSVASGVMLLAYFDSRRFSGVLRFVHAWYPAPLIFLTFKELYLMVYPLHGRDYDGLLVAADRWIFGVDPTIWLSQFTHPLVTEILQIAYASFYFLLVVIGIEFWRRDERAQFFTYEFLVVYGFFLSYVGYFFLPAVGPRFTLHDFHLLNGELPGLFFTDALRNLINAGESIPPGVANPVAYAQRDVFPSGHTMMMLVMMHVVVMFRMRIRWFIIVTGTLLIIGTVYLRYHYVIDLIAGALFYGVCVWTGPRLEGKWKAIQGEWQR